MLSILDQNVVRGVFCNAGGEPWADEDIARAIGGDISENVLFIAELIRNQVVSRNHKGAIYSRRMVRDTEDRDAAAARKRNQRRRERNSDNSEKHTVSTRKKTKCVTHNVTPIVTLLSEEEREVEKEALSTCLSKQESPPNELHLKVEVETFDSEEEAFVRKIRDVYVNRGVGAPMVEVACFEAIETEVEERKWRRSEVANYIVERTSIAADLMKKWPKDKQNYWPTLYTFMHERRYNDEISIWERSDGNGTKPNGSAVIDGALERRRARRTGNGIIQEADGKLPQFQD